MPNTPDAGATSLALLGQIQNILQTMQRDYNQLAAAVDVISRNIDILSEVKETQDVARKGIHDSRKPLMPVLSYTSDKATTSNPELDLRLDACGEQSVVTDSAVPPRISYQSIGISRIILTTYPGQSGIDPIAMQWGHEDPKSRGPVVVSRSQSTIRRRNGMFLQFLGYTND